MTRILITGDKGYIGRHLMASYEGLSGVLVRGLDKRDMLEDPLTCLYRVLDNFEPEVVIHCGAIRDSSYGEPDIHYWNTYFTNRLAYQCAGAKVHLVFLSSCLAEHPLTHYGWSKRLSEEYLEALSYGDYCVLRLFNVWGHERLVDPRCWSVPTQILQKRLKYLFDIERDYVHVLDVVRAIRIAVDTCGRYDVGTGYVQTPHSLAASVGYRAEHAIPEKVLGASIPHRLCASLENPWVLPGWKPKPFALRWEEERCS